MGFGNEINLPTKVDTAEINLHKSEHSSSSVNRPLSSILTPSESKKKGERVLTKMRERFDDTVQFYQRQAIGQIRFD